MWRLNESGEKIREMLDHYFHPISPQQEWRKGVEVSESNAIGGKVSGDSPFFPFALDDLQYWVIKRKDGTIVKYRVVGPEDRTKVAGFAGHPSSPSTQSVQVVSSVPALSAWCKHNPAPDPVWQGEKVDLYIADCVGCRSYKDEFDFVLDCGDILSASYINHRGTNLTIEGDEELVKSLTKFTTNSKVDPRCLRIDWDDRAAPPVKFEFWPALLKKVSGTLLTACQGGHGRSGTSLVCMMMALNPEYSPADAIIHLRAIHCPRAIESITQHTYINDFGKFLGREGDVARVKGVMDFKAEFLKLKMKSAQPYQDRLINNNNKEKK